MHTEGSVSSRATFRYTYLRCTLECSRRDDLESLAYMLIYFVRGTLPWRKIRADTVAGTWDAIYEAKVHALGALSATNPLCLDDSDGETESDSEASSDVDQATTHTTAAAEHSVPLSHRYTPRKPRASSIHPTGTPHAHRCLRTPSSAYPSGSNAYSPSTRTTRRAQAVSAPCPLTAALPREFHTLLAYARSLRFSDLPDYAGLRDMFRTLGARAGVTDAVYAREGRGDMDWECGRARCLPSNGNNTPGSYNGVQTRGRSARVCEACNAAAVSAGKQEQ